MDFEFKHFITRQDRIYDRALRELKDGEKISCWMWFIFPQLRALGRSRKAQVFGISGPDEAERYLSHPKLGSRLIECCKALLLNGDKTAEEILGETDARKLHASMTLFAQVSEENSIFHEIIDRFFGGSPDFRTVVLVKWSCRYGDVNKLIGREVRL